MWTHFPTIFDWSFGWGLRTPNFWEEETLGGRARLPEEETLNPDDFLRA